MANKILTSFDLIFEGVFAVGQELLDVLRVVGHGEIDDFQQLLRMMKVEDLARPVESAVQIIHQDLRHLVQKFTRLRLALAVVRKQICSGTPNNK